jgi:hypothetical protein
VGRGLAADTAKRSTGPESKSPSPGRAIESNLYELNLAPSGKRTLIATSP